MTALQAVQIGADVQKTNGWCLTQRPHDEHFSGVYFHSSTRSSLAPLTECLLVVGACLLIWFCPRRVPLVCSDIVPRCKPMCSKWGWMGDLFQNLTPDPNENASIDVSFCTWLRHLSKSSNGLIWISWCLNISVHGTKRLLSIPIGHVLLTLMLPLLWRQS